MIYKYEIFVENKINAKFKTVDYKIILKDLKDNPITLITDFKIINSEDKKVTIKGKGFSKETLSGWDEGKKKKGWVSFDDFEDDKTRLVWNKNFENGTKKIKVYES